MKTCATIANRFKARPLRKIAQVILVFCITKQKELNVGNTLWLSKIFLKLVEFRHVHRYQFWHDCLCHHAKKTHRKTSFTCQKKKNVVTIYNTDLLCVHTHILHISQSIIVNSNLIFAITLIQVFWLWSKIVIKFNTVPIYHNFELNVTRCKTSKLMWLRI